MSKGLKTYAFIKFIKEHISHEDAEKFFKDVQENIKQEGFELELKSFTSLRTMHWYICNAYSLTGNKGNKRPRSGDVTAAIEKAMGPCEYKVEDGAVNVSKLK